jgi:hypothetical protein
VGCPKDANGFGLDAAAGDPPDGAVRVMLADLPKTNFPGVAPAFPGGVKFRNVPPPVAAPAGLVSAEDARPPPKTDDVVEVVATPPNVGFVEVELPKKEGFGQSGSDCKGGALGTPNANGVVLVVLVPNVIGFETG